MGHFGCSPISGHHSLGNTCAACEAGSSRDRLALIKVEVQRDAHMPETCCCTVLFSGIMVKRIVCAYMAASMHFIRDLPIFINDGVRKSIQGDMAMGDWVESIISKQAFEEGVLQFAAQWLRRSSSSTPWTWHQATNALVRDAHKPLS